MVETDRAVASRAGRDPAGELRRGLEGPDVYVISKDAFSKPEPYGIMLRKDDPAFKRWQMPQTAALYTPAARGKSSTTSGSCRRSPPKGLNLNSPISPELKAEFAKPSDSPEPDSYKAM